MEVKIIPQTNISGPCLCVKRRTLDEYIHLLIHAFVPPILGTYTTELEGILYQNSLLKLCNYISV
jgi:hypothetical protein